MTVNDLTGEKKPREFSFDHAFWSFDMIGVTKRPLDLLQELPLPFLTPVLLPLLVKWDV